MCTAVAAGCEVVLVIEEVVPSHRYKCCQLEQEGAELVIYRKAV